MVKNLLAMQEPQMMQIQSPDKEVPPETTHSSIPAWRIPWTEAQRVTVHRVKKSRTRLID